MATEHDKGPIATGEQYQTEWLLETVVNAMLSSLTPEQQAKLAHHSWGEATTGNAASGKESGIVGTQKGASGSATEGILHEDRES